MSQGAKRGADLKVVIIGKSGVGKTALMQRFVHDQFDKALLKATIGASFVLKEWKGLHLAIWDTAGMEQYSPLTSFYSRDAAAAVIAYDITDRSTFEGLEKYWETLQNAKKNCVVIVAGTKYDLVEEGTPAEVSAEEGRELCKKMNALRFFETSAKTGQNVNQIFDAMCKELYPNQFKEGAPISTTRISEDRPAMASRNGSGTVTPGADDQKAAQQQQSCCK